MAKRKVQVDQELAEMVRVYETSKAEFRPSKYWAELNRKNVEQLSQSGYENFKQTVARNYFLWQTGLRDPQVRYLVRSLPVSRVALAFARALLSRRHAFFTIKQSVIYNFVTYLLWEYVGRQGAGDFLARLEEPRECNPPSVRLGGREISQDLAHSVLEIRAITEATGMLRDVNVIMELGAGYGRNAFAFLKLFPRLRYIIVDIPPALYISQRYLTSQFPDWKIFGFRSFENFSAVEEEWNSSRIAFLLPGQIEMLPRGSVDLFLAIDSLHEMRPDQITYYFHAVERLARCYFYFKCWKETIVPYDNVRLRECDYPILPRWSKLFWRDCDVLTFWTRQDNRLVESRYFEALFSLGDTPVA